MLHVSVFVLVHVLQLVVATDLMNGTLEYGEDYMDYIFGGYKAEKHTPWMAYLGNCGGAIISDQAILTAAHCIKWNAKNPKYVVTVGSDRKEYEIARTFHNKKFDINLEPILGNDIALFITKEKIRFGPSVQAICLPRKPMWGAKINLSGFGAVTTFIDEYKKLHAAEFKRIKLVAREDWRKYKKLITQRSKNESVRKFLNKIQSRMVAAIKALFPGLGDIFSLLRSGVVPPQNKKRCIMLLTAPIGLVPNNITPDISRQALVRGVGLMESAIKASSRGKYNAGPLGNRNTLYPGNDEQRFLELCNIMMDLHSSPLMAEVASPILMQMDGTILSPETCRKPKRTPKASGWSRILKFGKGAETKKSEGNNGLLRASTPVPWDGTCLDVSNSSFCSGDSGGPISTRRPDGKNYVLGVVAYNSQTLEAFPDLCNCNCVKGEAMDQDIVTRVDIYTKWIKRTLKEKGLSAPAC